jgi:hypothetical protein
MEKACKGIEIIRTKGEERDEEKVIKKSADRSCDSIGYDTYDRL